MMKSAVKRIACLLTAATVALASGCGNQGVAAGSGNTEGNEDSGEGKETAMGRYVEVETDLSEELQVVCSLRRTADGKLAISDRYQGILVSEDQGASWKEEGRQWLEGRNETAYVMDIQVAPDGTLGIIYDEYGEEGEDETDSLFQLSPDCVLLTLEEQVIPVTFPAMEEDAYPTNFWISDTGRYFVSTTGEEVYEVKEDGSSQLFLTAEGSPQLIQFLGDLMILDGYDFPAPMLYDMEKKEYVEDQAFAAFVKDNYPDRGFNGSSWYDMYFFPGEDGALYLAGKKGLHRHVVGGEETEQLIEGSLSRLGSPRYGIKSMVLLESGEFLAVFNSGKLVRFTYDPNVASVPSEKLKIYSLEESYDIRTAAASYQVQNPEVFVEYEVGMEEGSGITREDALKKLNTQILAGEGPDLLMLDGLPADSYIEKGLLADLSGVVESLGEDTLFENLLCGYEKEGRVYAVPGQVFFPLVLGRKEDVSKMSSLEGIAEGVEKMRRDNPGAAILDLCSEKAVMKVFAPVCAPAWRTEKGEIDRAAIEEFLIQMKRIYEAQMEGINEKSVERYWQSSEYYTQALGEDWMYDISIYGINSLDYVAGNCLFQAGITTYPYGYFDITSVSKAEGFEDVALAPMEGQQSGVFVPETVLGMNAASSRKELAEDFLKMFFGKENQCSLGGFGVNKAAFEELLLPEEEYLGENGEYGAMAMIDEDGLEFTLNVFYPTDQEIARLRSWMETSDIPYIVDPVFEDTVFEEGSKFILGQQELSQALDAIEQQIAIYMAE